MNNIDSNEDRLRNEIRDALKKSQNKRFENNNLTNIEEINVVEIVEKIRKQLGMLDLKVENIPMQEIETKIESINKEELSNIYKFGKKINSKLKRYESLNPLLHSIRSKIPSNIKYKDNINIKEMLVGSDDEFIVQAYNRLLNRAPDFEGIKNCKRNLEITHGNRAYVLGTIRYSREGKQNNVNISGLKAKYYQKRAMNLVYKIPVIGYIIQLMIVFLTLPKKMDCLYKGEYINHRDINNTRIQLNQAIEDEYNKIIIKSDELIRQIKDIEIDINDIKEEMITKHIIKRMKEEINEVSKGNEIVKKELIKKIEVIYKQICEKIEIEVGGLEKKVYDNILNKESLNLFEGLYLEFENKFRGSREEIKERMRIYLPYIEEIDIKNNHNDTMIIDVGCGRGEWLELLKENRFRYTGIDMNQKMIDECKRYNLNVVKDNGIEYIKLLEDNSINVITAIQVVEHMTIDQIVELFRECYRVLKTGGAIIFETPNPENIIVGACNFYFDPTHQKPIPPLQLHYLAEIIGYKDIEILRQHPYEFIAKEDKEKISSELRPLVDLFNNQADYAVIAYKN